MLKLISLNFLIILFAACSDTSLSKESYVSCKNEYVFDATRNRQIPIQIYTLADSTRWNGELVILNAGYGSSNTEYSYITSALADKGYYVISIQHEIQSDEPLPSGDDMIALRTPNWREGIKSIEQVLKHMKKKTASISTKKIHLIGHSNGGDISVLFASENSKRVHSLITLDHRRMPIPLSKDFKTLSFRSDEFEVDAGVIPSSSDQKEFGIEIVYLKNVNHNYLRDIGTKETKSTVISSIFQFLNFQSTQSF